MVKTEPSLAQRKAAKNIGFIAALFSLPGLLLIVDDLRQRGEFLDGLMASLGGTFVGACFTVTLLAWLSFTRKTKRWQTVWLVLMALVFAGVVSCVLVVGVAIGSGG